MNDWYQPLRSVASLGQSTAKAATLGELHRTRTEHLGMFFTPEPVVALMWQLLEPAMAAWHARHPAHRLRLFDNSVGSGRLFSRADPARHTLAGVDVHAPTVEALMRVAQAAGFDVEVHVAGMEATRARGFDVALINPPFSLHLEAPTLERFPSTCFGRFGPHTSANSTTYALDHALAAAPVVIALLPRTTAVEAAARRDLAARLRAVVHLPQDAFASEHAHVSTSLVCFGVATAGTAAPALYTLDSLDTPAPPVAGLDIPPPTERPARLRVVDVDDEGPAIRAPLTGDARVRVVRNGRRIGLRFADGLVEAKVLNAIYRAPVPHPDPPVVHRYPRGVRYVGQGVLDVPTLLAQPDPVAAFTEHVLAPIAAAGGRVDVDPGIVGYLRRASRRLATQRESFARIAWIEPERSTHALPNTGRLTARARTLQQLDASTWGSPVLKPNDPVVVEAVASGALVRYRVSVRDASTLVSAEQLTTRFDVDAPAPAAGWHCVARGRLERFPERAAHLERRARALGIDRWLDFGYQLPDLIELALGRGHAIVGHEMGLGKSRMAAALCLLGGGCHNLIVSEAHLVYELAKELRKIGLDPTLWQLIESPEDLDTLKCINLVSYSRLRLPIGGAPSRRTYARVLRHRVHTLVADECHCAAQADALQTQALWLVSPKVRYGMSGTPIPNYPRNLVPILQYVAGDGTPLQPYGRFGAVCRAEHLHSLAFAQRGIDAFRTNHVSFVWVTREFEESMQQGAKREVPAIRNVAAFREWIAPLIKRRLRSEPACAVHVPIQEPSRVVHDVEFDAAHLAHYLRIADHFATWFRQAKVDADRRGVQLNLALLLRRILEVQLAVSVPQRPREGPSCYRGGPTAKQRAVAAHLEALVQGGERALCFAHFPAALDVLAELLRARGLEAVVLDGRSTPRQRMRAIDASFHDGTAPLLLLTFKANRNGLNLPEANRVVLYDRDWTPKTEEQAIGRVMRPQQHRAVTVDYWHVAGSLDTYMAQLSNAKRIAAHAGLDWGEQGDAPFLHLDVMLERYVRDVQERSGLSREALKAVSHAA